jgi:DNA polymerase III sliding clamp (beta) subunit (PCNA family)
MADISLPFDAVPPPSGWAKLGEETPKMLQQAARTCGKDLTQELTTYVHVTPAIVEACDNFRLFRTYMKTGFPEEGLLPYSSVLQLGRLPIKRVAMGEGWTHFRIADRQTISIRCSHEEYPDMNELLQIGDAEELTLPANLGEIVERTVVMMNAEEEPSVRVQLSENQLVLESRKDSGWYKEKKRIKYEGSPMEFDINPKFLVEILSRTRKVMVNSDHRMKLEADGIQFVVALTKPE